MKRSIRRRRKSDRSGVTNVVSLVMISGILISLMGVVFSTYLPSWGKDLEARTLNDVMDSFMDLKSAMDTLAVRGDDGTSLTTKITLGSNGGPMFGFGRCTGSFELREDGGIMRVTDETGSLFSASRGSFHFRSHNTYVEEQAIIIEAGALMREQGGFAALKGPPNVFVSRDVNSNEVVLYIMASTIEGDVQSYTGTGTYMVSTTLLSQTISSFEVSAGSSITINMITEYGTIWKDHIEGMMSRIGFTTYTTEIGTDLDGEPTFEVTSTGIDRMEIRSAVFKVTVT